jgi:hypothetical protein
MTTVGSTPSAEDSTTKFMGAKGSTAGAEPSLATEASNSLTTPATSGTSGTSVGTLTGADLSSETDVIMGEDVTTGSDAVLVTTAAVLVTAVPVLVTTDAYECPEWTSTVAPPSADVLALEVTTPGADLVGHLSV